MALFYTIPIAAVQAIIEVNRLYKITFFRKLLDITFIRSIIQAILPGRQISAHIFKLLLEFLASFVSVITVAQVHPILGAVLHKSHKEM